MIKQITEAIKYYQENYNSMSGDLLSSCQDKIVTLLYNISEEVATALEVYLQAKLDRKMGILDFASENVLEGLNKTEARAKAERDSKQLYEEENKADVNYKRYKMLMQSAQDVVQSIRQRISVMKKEKSNSNYG